MQPDEFMGLSVAGWTAIGAVATIALALATIAVAWVAGYQISAARAEAAAARDEAKRQRTLEVVSRYDHDPVLDRALRRMARARDSGRLFTDARTYRTDVIAVMNYFEAIAIGLKQDIYILEMVRDYMEPVFRSHIGWKPKSTVHFKGGHQ